MWVLALINHRVGIIYHRVYSGTILWDKKLIKWETHFAHSFPYKCIVNYKIEKIIYLIWHYYKMSNYQIYRTLSGINNPKKSLNQISLHQTHINNKRYFRNAGITCHEIAKHCTGMRLPWAVAVCNATRSIWKECSTESRRALSIFRLARRW